MLNHSSKNNGTLKASDMAADGEAYDLYNQGVRFAQDTIDTWKLQPPNDFNRCRNFAADLKKHFGRGDYRKETLFVSDDEGDKRKVCLSLPSKSFSNVVGSPLRPLCHPKT
jgi:hypothetical protein